MALGTITFRISEELACQVGDCVERRLRSRAAPQSYSVSDFIRDAVVEKISHQARSRKSSSKRRGRASMIRGADYSGYAPISGSTGLPACPESAEANL